MQFSGRLVIITALAVSVLIISNIVAIKPVSLFEMPFEFLGSNLFVVSASVICFPIGYIISDVLTEVYGFRVARGVIWLGFACNLMVVGIIWIVLGIPGAVFWGDQEAYETILGATAWVLLGSFVAYLVGEFSNAIVMVVLKHRTKGRMLWLRTISSTVVGQGVDSILFYSIAFGVSGVSLFEMPFEFLGSNLFVVSASVICFPIGYIISDVLTEVYGFRVARGVIWLGFACNLMVVGIIWIVLGIPGAVFWGDQEAYETILGATAWVLLGSFVAYLVGEFSNAIVMVVLKHRTKGRMLWLRTISSTVVGQGVDSILFYSIAFGVSGIWGWEGAINGAILAWLAKTVYEIAATPLTYAVVNWLKKTEKMDVYDVPSSLNPFGVFGDADKSSYNAATA